MVALQLPVKPKQLIDIITQYPEIMQIYQASTGQILQQQLRDINEPYSHLLQLVLLPKQQLCNVLIQQYQESSEIIFVLCVILMSKNNQQMVEFEQQFDFNGIDLYTFISSTISNLDIRRVFIAISAGSRSEQMDDLLITDEISRVYGINDQKQLFSYILYVLCSCNKESILLIHQKINLIEKIQFLEDKEVVFILITLFECFNNGIEKTLFTLAMKDTELLRKQKLGILLTYLKDANFKQILGEPDFKESTQSYEYEVLYQLWK
ncbi:hypothetical protein SS50377_26758 [Spironucleus salmonicida]|nr:hypothetical protein SS50377_26758 [Spironucleus salmonicida]